MAQSLGIQLVCVVLEALSEFDYAPLGPMYSAFNAKGMSLDDFNMLMNTLPRYGMIKLTAETAKITTIGVEALRSYRKSVCELN